MSKNELRSSGEHRRCEFANGAVNVRTSTEGHKWRGKRLNHDKYICEMEKIA